jgi:hypothetical protein
MRTYGIWLFLLANNSIGLLAQEVIQPGADAMELARLANTPVNYYTGTPSINIPLTQIGGNELNVPVNLSYNASGHRIQDIASSVGLGWNLSAGGLITRVVRGLPDDATGGFCTPSPTDTEPDLYYFVLPGRSGKFFMKFGKGHTIPWQDIDIKVGICGYNSVWEITDENGVNYKFGVNSAEKETTSSTRQGVTSSFISTWFLSEINSPNKTEKIQFSYNTNSSTTTTNHFFQRVIDPCGDQIIDMTSSVNNSSKLLTSISAPMGTITLTWGGTRSDFPGAKQLISIETKNLNNELISKYKFGFGYFQVPGCATSDCYRLRLEKIFDLAPDPIYLFSYNTSVNLPSRYSKNFDHWGYHNSNTINSWIPEIPGYPGASRQPDAAKQFAYLLTTINLRGGGASKVFEYENNFVNSGGANALVGGVRIKKITENDGNGGSVTKEFNYASESNPVLSSGISYRTPKYDYYISLYNGSLAF